MICTGTGNKIVHSFTQNSLHVIYRIIFTNTDTCILMNIYSKIQKQKDTHEHVHRPGLIWGIQTSKQGTCTQKRFSQDTETRIHRIGGIQRLTEEKNVEECNVPGEHSVCRPSEAVTRISLQENIYIETYKCPVALKVIYKLVWTHRACSVLELSLNCARSLLSMALLSVKPHQYEKKITWFSCKDCRYENTYPYIYKYV